MRSTFLILLLLVPSVLAEVDCRTACHNCHEQEMPTEMLEIYCSMCMECKERRKDRLKMKINIEKVQSKQAHAANAGQEEHASSVGIFEHQIQPDQTQFIPIGCPTPPPCSEDEELEKLPYFQKTTTEMMIIKPPKPSIPEGPSTCPPMKSCIRRPQLSPPPPPYYVPYPMPSCSMCVQPPPQPPPSPSPPTPPPPSPTTCLPPPTTCPLEPPPFTCAPPTTSSTTCPPPLSPGITCPTPAVTCPPPPPPIACSPPPEPPLLPLPPPPPPCYGLPVPCPHAPGFPWPLNMAPVPPAINSAPHNSAEFAMRTTDADYIYMYVGLPRDTLRRG